jgi:menaquinone-dependent protoporphyrinogen oxidase
MSRVLVSYGTKHGATAEIAEHIGATLRKEGHEVVVSRAREAPDPAAFDAVVLGSAVYMGRWRSDALALLKRLGRQDGGLPVWLFSSGPGADDRPDSGSRWMHPTKVRKAGERIGARDQVVFGGRVPPEPSNFMERSMLRKTPEDKRDARDFEAIAAWARGIADELRAGASPR